jgi:hypothetical protein
MFTITYTENGTTKTFKTYAIDSDQAIECFWDCMTDRSQQNNVVDFLSIVLE